MPDDARVAPRLDDALLALCGLSWAAGLVHAIAAWRHVEESVLHAALLAALGCAQLAWGAALYRAPSRRLLAAGAAVSLVVVALWGLSRTAGLPLAPRAWTPEPVGALDLLASADQLVLVVLATLRLGARRSALVQAGAACLILFSSLAAVLPGSGH